MNLSYNPMKSLFVNLLSSSSRKWCLFQNPIPISKMVKNFEESEILFNMKASKLDSRCFPEAGKRYPYVREKVNLFLTATSYHHLYHVPRTLSKGDVSKVHAVGCHKKNPSLGNSDLL